MSSSTTDPTQQNIFLRQIFKPHKFGVPRAHVVREAFTNRRATSTADDLPLLEHFVNRSVLGIYAKLLRDDCPLPSQCSRVLFSQALHWEGMGGRRENETLLFETTDVESDAATTAAAHSGYSQPTLAAVVVCTIIPSLEARRSYTERLDFLPLGAAAASGTSGNDEPLLRRVPKNAPPAMTSNENLLVDKLSELALSGERSERLATLRQVLPGASDSIFVALERADQVGQEQMLLDAEKSSIDELTRWRIATIVTRSFFFAFRVRGFVRLDYVRLCAQLHTVRGRSYYLLGDDVPTRSVNTVLAPPAELLRYEEELAVRRNTTLMLGGGGDATTSTTTTAAPPVVEVSDGEDVEKLALPQPVVHIADDDDDGDVALSQSTNTNTQHQQQQRQPLPSRQSTSTIAPGAHPPTGIVVDNYRPPHLLDLLRTVLHIDTADDDVVDIEELEMSANHRLRVLATMADLALADPDASLEQLALTNQVSVADREIAAHYPHGYLAPRTASYAGAPGLRSFATPRAYAALGLGMLCVAVRNDTDLFSWLQYTEALLGARSMTRAEIDEHLTGISEFVEQTDEPDPVSEPLLATLITQIRRKMRQHKVERVLQRIAADGEDESSADEDDDESVEATPVVVDEAELVI